MLTGSMSSIPEGQGCERLNSLRHRTDPLRTYRSCRAVEGRCPARPAEVLSPPRGLLRRPSVIVTVMMDEAISGYTAGAVRPTASTGNMTMAEHHPAGFPPRVGASSPIDAARTCLPLPCLLDVFCELIVNRRAGLFHFGCIHGEAFRAPLVEPSRIVVLRFLQLAPTTRCH